MGLLSGGPFASANGVRTIEAVNTMHKIAAIVIILFNLFSLLSQIFSNKK
jgi:hypothetical protein